MGDMGEFWKDVKPEWNKIKKQKKQENHKNSVEILMTYNVDFKSADGVHYIIENRFDFWPTTGLFKNRKDGRKGRGVRSLLRALEREGILQLFSYIPKAFEQCQGCKTIYPKVNGNGEATEALGMAQCPLCGSTDLEDRTLYEKVERARES